MQELSKTRQVPVASLPEADLAVTRSGDSIATRTKPPASADRAPLPAAIGGYEILKELGRGNMGIVYLARHAELKRLVALKVILSGEFATANQLTRFRREALAAARLKHPNIVQIHATGKHSGWPYFVLEYVEGGNLDARLLGKPQPPRSAARLLEKLARAVHAAHDRGVVHRDLKPANILLDQKDSLARPLEKCTPKIADFGLARILDGDEDGEGKSLSNVVTGTPSYMSPEQARAGAISPATDVYALGVILYEMLTGRVPFQGTSILHTLEMICQQEPVSPRQLQSKCPRDLETICLKCLEKDPNKRYGNAEELADDCAAFLANRPPRARPVGALGKTQRWARRNPSVAALLAAVALLLLGGTAIASSLAVRARYWAATAQARAEDANRQAERAERLAATEAEERLRAEWMNYSNQVCVAQREFERGMTRKARMKLDQCRDDFRHWEHAHLSGSDKEWSAVVNAHSSPITCVALDPTGRRFASAQGQTLRVWKVSGGEVVRSIDCPTGAIRAVAFSTDGERVMAAANDGSVTVWQLADGRRVSEFATKTQAVQAVAFSPDGKWLALSDRTTFGIWDVASGRPVRSLGGPVTAVAFSVAPLLLAGASGDDVRVWNLAGERQATLPMTNPVAALALSPDGSQLAVAGKHLVVWQLRREAPRVKCSDDEAALSCVRFSADGRRLFTGSADQMVKVWEASRGLCLLTLEGHTSAITCLALSPDGRLVSADHDGRARVWIGSIGAAR